MIRTRTGKDPVSSSTPSASASYRSPSALTPSYSFPHPSARHLRGLLRLARRRSLAVALLAGSVAATVTTVAAVNLAHTTAARPLASARPVASAAEALRTQAALAPRPKHRIADALRQPLAQLQHLSALHPLRGIASWYGSMWHGRPTASGERFDEAALTAAHRTLPLGTVVRVTNLRTLRSVIVRINDRGTLGPGRVIDLSSAAAQQLGMLQAGTAQVKLEILQKPAQS